ncbi:hypothetical protein [Varibaculum cambriense]|uniref:hypothetical protein n=1 Tax=Varibaculum cambriense TaxID=184870 RepID=UPI0039F46DE9
MQILLATASTPPTSAREGGQAFKTGWLKHQSRDQLQVVPYSWAYPEVAAGYPLGDLFSATSDPVKAGKRLPELLKAGIGLYLPAVGGTQNLQSEYLPLGALAPVNLEDLPEFPRQFLAGVAAAYGAGQMGPQVWESLARDLAGTLVVTGSQKPLLSASGVLAQIAKTSPQIAQQTKENWEGVLKEAEKYGRRRYLEISDLLGKNPAPGTQIGTLPAGGCAWGVGELLGRLGARLDFAADFLDQQTSLPQVLETTDLLVANTEELSPWNLPSSPLEHLCDLANRFGVPIVVFTSENNLSRGEIAERGIDGVYQFPTDISSMEEAGLRLARTWSQ